KGGMDIAGGALQHLDKRELDEAPGKCLVEPEGSLRHAITPKDQAQANDGREDETDSSRICKEAARCGAGLKGPEPLAPFRTRLRRPGGWGPGGGPRGPEGPRPPLTHGGGRTQVLGARGAPPPQESTPAGSCGLPSRSRPPRRPHRSTTPAC